jgi:uncharacterized protein YjdB
MKATRLGSGAVRWSVFLLTACDLNLMGASSCARSVTVSPPAATVAVGETAKLYATVRDSAGNALRGSDVTWSSDAPAIASVDQTGLVRGVAPGQTTVWAAAEGQSGSAAITVMAQPPAGSGPRGADADLEATRRVRRQRPGEVHR